MKHEHPLQEAIEALFTEQKASWPLVDANYAALEQVEERILDLGVCQVRVQYNPARMASSGAKIDAVTLSKRPCFLCPANRPSEQRSVEWNNYELLVNPYPIFPKHFTIAAPHEMQKLLPFVGDMLQLAKELPNYIIFYNGARCGASAPDHRHFQAGSRGFLPLEEDYKRLRIEVPTAQYHSAVQLYMMPPTYGRMVLGLEENNLEALIETFTEIYEQWQIEPQEEPMMNVVCWYEANRWQLLMIPRKAFRPWQYGMGNAPELLVSPATVEMGGIIITPIEAHFKRITANDVMEIYGQVGL